MNRRRGAAAGGLAPLGLFLAIAAAPGTPPVEGEATGRSSDPSLRAMLEGRWEDALAVCEGALAEAPGSAAAQGCRAHALVALGRVDDARRAMVDLVRRSPIAAVETEGYLRVHFGDLRSAREHFEYCVDRALPQNVFCRAQLVHILQARGDEAGAARRAREAVAALGEAGALARDVLWHGLTLESDRRRIEALLGTPLPLPARATGGPPADADPSLRAHLPILRSARARMRVPLAPARGWYTVRATIDGERVRLLLDTGANYVTLRREIAEKLDLRPLGRITSVAEGEEGPLTREFALARRLRVGNARFERVPVGISHVSANPADGVLPAKLFGDFLVDLDFPARRMRLHPRDGTGGIRPALGAAVSFQMLVYDGRLLVPGGVEKSLRGWFLVDTGADIDFFHARFLPQLARVGVRPTQTPPGADPPISISAWGKTTGTYLTPFRATFGPIEIDCPRARAVAHPGDTDVWTIGAFGMETLGDFRLLLDYRAARMTVARPSGTAAPSGPAVEPPEPELPELLTLVGPEGSSHR